MNPWADMIRSSITLGPELILVLGGLIAIAHDIIDRKTAELPVRQRSAACIGMVTCLLAAVASVILACTGVRVELPGGHASLIPAIAWIKALLAILGCVAILLSRREIVGRYPSEFYAVILFSLAGMSLMASSRNILMLFVAVELASLASYILAAFRRGLAAPTEAALKYFTLGSAASAFLLYGLTWIYGLTGALDYATISQVLTRTPPSMMTAVAMIMVLGGFAFKLAAAPMHFWVADVYRQAPVSVVALLATASKVAAVVALGRWIWEACSAPGTLAWLATDDFRSGPLVVLALVSVIAGNGLALVQKDVRRLLAYSAVAHAGYLLVGLAAGPGGAAREMVLLYAVIYALSTCAALVGWFRVKLASGADETILGLSGAARRDPFGAVLLAAGLLSLAGLPPLGGFFGKLGLFLAALQNAGNRPELIFLVAVALAAGCLGFYYYLRVLKVLFILEPSEPPTGFVSVAACCSERVAAWILLGLLLLLGLMPQLVIAALRAGW
jgi:NADH-quinone oxidoreductase subunit N